MGVSAGEFDGRPMAVRAISNQPDEATRQRFGTLCLISWDYSSGATENGMPLPDMAKSMTRWEIGLDEHLDIELDESGPPQGIAIKAIIATNNGLRRLFYYAQKPTEFVAAFESAKAALGPAPVTLDVQADPTWGAFQAYYGPTP